MNTPPGGQRPDPTIVLARTVEGLHSTVRRFGVGKTSPLGASIWDLAQYSPQLALARYQGVQLAPYLLNIRAAFTDGTTTTNPASFDGATNNSGNISLSQPSIIDEITYQITQPNNFGGNIFKPQYDFYFQRQSGLEATMIVEGAPRYAVAPFMTPLESLMSTLAESWPCGWVLGYTQSILMQFQQTIPAPSFPTNICVTFRIWQPIGTDDFQMMSAATARASLTAAGVLQPPAPIPALT